MKKYEQYVSKEDVLKIHEYSVRILSDGELALKRISRICYID